MRLQDAWTLPNLQLAWRRITTGSNVPYKRYFRNLYHIYEIGLQENLKDLQARLKGGSYRPQPPTKVYLPKPSGLQRPLTLLALEDQIVLQAIANVFARKVFRRRRRVEHKHVFSHILQSPKDSIFFLQNWPISYSEFQATVRRYFNEGYRWIAHFDLAAFYDTICHDLLLHSAFPRTTEDDSRKRIMEWLKTWSSELITSGHAHGIPQGPIASNFLAECFLLPVDEQLSKKLKYVRYVDDIRLFARTHNRACKAAIEMEVVLRSKGLIPQGKKHAITYAKTPADALGLLPSIQPTDDAGKAEGYVLPSAGALNTLRSAVSRRSHTITDKTRARYVLFHSEPSSKLLNLVLRLLPHHPEHIDAFAHHLLQYKRSVRIVRVCNDVLRKMPYEYVQGEMWHILANMIKPEQMRSLLTRAVRAAKKRDAGLALKWGACRFLCAAERAGMGDYGKWLMYQKIPLLQALLAPELPDARFARGDVAEKMLRRKTPEPGMALAGPLVRLRLSHRSYGIRSRNLPKQVQNTFKALRMIRGPIPAVDPLGEILARRYGIAQWEGWKGLLGNEYPHALHLLAIADSAYDVGKSEWLSNQNSFNHALFIALQVHLNAHNLPGAVKIVDRNSNPIKFGSLVDANQLFAKTHPTIAGAFRLANARRNRLPASHPYDFKGGAPTRHLGKREQTTLVKRLKKAYAAIYKLLA